jgi:CDP-paratose 2-epimerase
MKALITGGAGFIGCNAASRFLRRGDEVVLIDNLSRKGAAANLNWLWPQGHLTFINADVRDASRIASIFREHADSALVLHLAAQVAVTQSLVNPRLDFEVNSLGTLNVLEAARTARIVAPIIYSSTNKVYGQLSDVDASPGDAPWSSFSRAHGIPEERRLDFHSPYGCSKGAADQYVRDYHRVYGLNTVVMRQSCVYGCRQFGIEDQGWVAWFAIAAASGRTITLYGNGHQVRDILYVDDLLDAFEAAAANIAIAAGAAYNIGGGPDNAVSLLDVIAFIERRNRRPIPRRLAPERTGDQRLYVSDIRRAHHDLGWIPRTGWRTGVDRLCAWVAENLDHLR